MSPKQNVTSPYAENPKVRLRELMAFAYRLRTEHILGEEDQEYRKELNHLLNRTMETIEEVREEIFMTGKDDTYV